MSDDEFAEFDMSEDEFDAAMDAGEPIESIVGLRWEYDPSVNAGYVKIRPGDVARTVGVDPVVNMDYDADGNLLGVEVLGSGPRRNTLTTSSVTGSSVTLEWRAS